MRYDTEVRREKLVAEVEALISNDLPVHGSVMALASETGVSVGFLSKVFKSVTGETLTSVLNGEKLRRAKKMLEATREDVKQICFRCGFDNPDHFCTWFKRRTQLTPTQFRAEHGTRKQSK